jgi:hypothetical protein
MRLGEFTLDEQATRHWLALTVTYRDAEQAGRQLPATAGIDPDTQLPEDITSTWNPKWAEDQGSSTDNLLGCAQETGVVARPAGAQVSFEWFEDGDGGYYRYLVEVTGPDRQRLRLASCAQPVYKLIADEEKGVDAAMIVLEEAVGEANHLLRQLEAFTAPYLQHARDTAHHEVVAGQGETTDCGCGWPITVYDGEWMHVFNPALTGSDDHDPEP